MTTEATILEFCADNDICNTKLVQDKLFPAFPEVDRETIFEAYRFYNQMPKPLFKGLYLFDDLFTVAANGAEIKKRVYRKDSETNKRYSELYTFSGYCTVKDCTQGATQYHKPIYILPKPDLFKRLTANMMAIKYDIKYFEMFIFGSEVKVYCKYGSIIGSRLIGRFTLDSIPLEG